MSTVGFTNSNTTSKRQLFSDVNCDAIDNKEIQVMNSNSKISLFQTKVFSLVIRIRVICTKTQTVTFSGHRVIRGLG